MRSTRTAAVVVAGVLAVGAAGAAPASAQPNRSLHHPDTNAGGIPLSAVDATMGIGPVAKTRPSAADRNVAGIPLSALDQLLGGAIQGGAVQKG